MSALRLGRLVAVCLRANAFRTTQRIDFLTGVFNIQQQRQTHQTDACDTAGCHMRFKQPHTHPCRPSSEKLCLWITWYLLRNCLILCHSKRQLTGEVCSVGLQLDVPEEDIYFRRNLKELKKSPNNMVQTRSYLRIIAQFACTLCARHVCSAEHMWVLSYVRVLWGTISVPISHAFECKKHIVIWLWDALKTCCFLKIVHETSLLRENQA